MRKHLYCDSINDNIAEAKHIVSLYHNYIQIETYQLKQYL